MSPALLRLLRDGGGCLLKGGVVQEPMIDARSRWIPASMDAPKTVEMSCFS